MFTAVALKKQFWGSDEAMNNMKIQKKIDQKWTRKARKNNQNNGTDSEVVLCYVQSSS